MGQGGTGPPNFHYHSIEMLLFSIQMCFDKLLCPPVVESFLLPALGVAQAGFAMVSGQGWQYILSFGFTIVICIVL